MTEMPYDERRLQLVREADGEDARTYCPPLDAPMSVQQRYAGLRVHSMGAHKILHGVESEDESLYGITDENAPRVLRAIFRDDAERKDFGAALAVWACIMGAVVGGAYLFAWLV